VGVLLAHGANIHARDAGGLQPIDCVNLYTPAIAAMLLLAGADPAALARTDEDGETLLHRAALVEDPEIVRVLLDHGADINARTTEGLTPREQAKHCSVIALLDAHSLRQRAAGCQVGGRRTAL
jgi:ankyrin repeat protein